MRLEEIRKVTTLIPFTVAEIYCDNLEDYFKAVEWINENIGLLANRKERGGIDPEFVRLFRHNRWYGFPASYHFHLNDLTIESIAFTEFQRRDFKVGDVIGFEPIGGAVFRDPDKVVVTPVSRGDYVLYDSTGKIAVYVRSDYIQSGWEDVVHSRPGDLVNVIVDRHEDRRTGAFAVKNKSLTERLKNQRVPIEH